MKKVVITYGDINGIGFEIMVKALNKLNLHSNEVMLVGAPEVFDFYREKYNLTLINKYELAEVTVAPGALEIGAENLLSGEHCFRCLQKACELVNGNKVLNIVTAPVSKRALNLAGHNYSGQTEVIEHFLAKKDEKSEMLFVTGDFRMLLLTRHVPLGAVAASISKDMIIDKITRLNKVLQEKFEIKRPKIALLALNPHAGENGLLGTEEQKIIKPAIRALNEIGCDVVGPLVADAAFAEFGKYYFAGKHLPYDCYVSMYHDQGLIPVKLLASDLAVNTTIGLSSIRTSPSHGTAYNIAGKNEARYSSMIAAIQLALKLAKNAGF